jgi:uncharacterized membrane protein
MSELFTNEEKALEEVVLTRLMRLNATIYGVVFGILVGLMIFIATIWLVIKGGPVVGPNLGLLSQFLIGYRVTVGGAFIGLIYGFIIGFVIGFAIATIYNWILDLKQRGKK